MTTYRIEPSIGIARVGDSPDSFYLAPTTIGGRPTECGPDGTPIVIDGEPLPVAQYKDEAGQIRRQAARFTIIATEDDGSTRHVTLSDDDIETITWSVHLANKKACWYEFSELEGDTMLGEDNSYAARKVALRNPNVQDRQKLITDPGPRTVTPQAPTADFSRDTIPTDYPHGSFPPQGLQPYEIDTLGNLIEDPTGGLLVLGALGHAGGVDPITSFGGANSWFDDIADGPVTAQIYLGGCDAPIEVHAWVVVGSPKFAPELVNLTTLDDVMVDVGVRSLGLAPDLYDIDTWPATYGWNPDYIANYQRDIEPILRRPLDYMWVANVPAMIDFAAPGFDTTDSSEASLTDRTTYVSYFRQPGGVFDDTSPELSPDHEKLLAPSGVPMMPLNSGTNSVSNTTVDKFMSLTPTQYYLLYQWGQGKFTTDPSPGWPTVSAADQAGVGNAVGHPMCPGIEVTWSTRNPAIYDAPFRIRRRQDATYYQQNGLDPAEDETDGLGCEPGDLTKRMAIPWQADFFECSVQWINFTDPEVNKEGGIPKPPTYYAYWWPPQSPMYVISGYMTADAQQAAGVNAGVQVYYPRGINSFAQMITAWKYMGFIVNTASGPDRTRYRNFEERERNHDQFVATGVAVGDASNVLNPTDQYFQPAWFLRSGGS